MSMQACGIQVERIAAHGTVTLDSGIVQILSLHKKVYLAVATLSFLPLLWPACCIDTQTASVCLKKVFCNCVAHCPSSCDHCIVCWKYFKGSVCADQRMYPTCGNAVSNTQNVYCPIRH